MQLAIRHPVLFDHGRQAPLPLQVPSLEQSPPAALLATHFCLGSALPSGTAEQVPAFPGTLQLTHNPPVAESLHAELQHSPSVQKPLAHCSPAVQAAPNVLRPQDPPTQVLGGTQSTSVLQTFSQAAELQMKVPHVRLGGVTQPPRPSHVDAGVAEELVAQTAGLQLSPLAKLAQAPDLQAPVVPQVTWAVASHFPCGSGWPSGTSVHSPKEAERLHAMQASLQAELQQIPCAQLLDWHSVGVLHSAPKGLRPQEPFTQKLPAMHSLSLEHATKQLEPLQVNGLHVSEGGATHWPDWLHVGAGVCAPATQISVPQTVPGAYFWQDPVPSQTPLVPQDALPLSVQVCRGSGAPPATFTH